MVTIMLKLKKNILLLLLILLGLFAQLYAKKSYETNQDQLEDDEDDEEPPPPPPPLLPPPPPPQPIRLADSAVPPRATSMLRRLGSERFCIDESLELFCCVIDVRFITA